MPEGFEKFLVELGGELVYKKRFLDHHRFDDSELEAFFDDAQKAGAQLAVCTEKDAVRIRADLPAPIPFYYTKLEIDILKGDDDFESAVEKICFPKRQSDKGEALDGRLQPARLRNFVPSCDTSRQL